MLVTQIQRFSTKDGPGIRTVVFLKGCPLRCVWCHNPETKSTRNEVYFAKEFCIGCGACLQCPAHCHTLENGVRLYRRENCAACGKCAQWCPAGALTMCAAEMSVEEIVASALRDKPFWGKTGGITLSGGEPLIHPECAQILRRVKEAGGTTAIETCGYVPRENLESVLAYTDLFFWDLKEGDSETHRRLTGVSPALIHDNLRFADAMGAKIVVRCIVAKGLNDSLDSFSAIGAICRDLKNLQHVELLKYHALGGGKERNLTGFDTTDKKYIPEEDDVSAIRSFLRRRFALDVK